MIHGRMVDEQRGWGLEVGECAGGRVLEHGRWKWQLKKGPLRPREKGPPVGSVSTSAHSDEIDHPFRSKPITRSDGNRSPVGASDAGPGIMSPGSLGSCRRSGLSHGLSLHVELERTRQRALTSRCSTPVGEVGPVLFQISRKKMMGCGRCGKPRSLRFSKLLWARSLRPWERWRPQPPAAHRQCCSGRAGTDAEARGVVCPPCPPDPP